MCIQEKPENEVCMFGMSLRCLYLIMYVTSLFTVFEFQALSSTFMVHCHSQKLKAIKEENTQGQKT